MEEKKIVWPGWETVKKIGKGGFGTVYEIRRENFDNVERKALKVITIPRDSGEVEYMLCEGMDEASISYSLKTQVKEIYQEYMVMSHFRDNPNIVHCDDFQYIKHEEDPGWDIYIRMELLTPLLKAMDRVKTEEQIVRLGKELCNALIDCQKVNIIHRDIKPQNIFVSANGVFKLGDFGIARSMEHTTKATVGIGTHSFMAPEVANGEKYGMAVDIYSLGLVMYWLLNERRGPFIPLPPAVPTYLDNDRARLLRNTGKPIPKPKYGNSGLVEIVLKACAFNPKDRFRNAAEMLDALNQLEYRYPEEVTVLEEHPDSDEAERDKDSLEKKESLNEDTVLEEYLELDETKREDRPEKAPVQKKEFVNEDTVLEECPAFDAEKRKEKTGRLSSEKRKDDEDTVLEKRLESGNKKKENPDKKDKKENQAVSGSFKMHTKPEAHEEHKKPNVAKILLTVAGLALAAACLLIGGLFGLRTGSWDPEHTQGWTVAETQKTEMPISPDAWKYNILAPNPMEKLPSGLKIVAVTFLSTLENAPESAIDVTETENGSVLAWLEEERGEYKLFIAGNGGVNGVQACFGLFGNMKYLKTVDFNGSFHTDLARTMANMFINCSALETVNFGKINTSNVRSMKMMFSGCTSLVNLDMRELNSENVTNMDEMFKNCSKLRTLNLVGFDTSKAVNMRNMFMGCSNLIYQNIKGIEHFDFTSAVDTKGFMDSGKNIGTISWEEFVEGRRFKSVSLPQIPEGAVSCQENGVTHYYYVYQLQDTLLTWNLAQKYCESLGGHLATLTSELQSKTAYSAIDQKKFDTCVYFGMSDNEKEGVWRWVTGETVSYTAWHEGEPNGALWENYGNFYFGFENDPSWNDGDFAEEQEKWIICEWDLKEQDAQVPSKPSAKTEYHIDQVGMEWSDERYYASGGASSPVLQLDREIKNCYKFTTWVKTENDANLTIKGTFDLYVRCNGMWRRVDSFKMDGASDEMEITFELDEPISFDAVSVICKIYGNFRFWMDVVIYDFWLTGE